MQYIDEESLIRNSYIVHKTGVKITGWGGLFGLLVYTLHSRPWIKDAKIHKNLRTWTGISFRKKEKSKKNISRRIRSRSAPSTVDREAYLGSPTWRHYPRPHLWRHQCGNSLRILIFKLYLIDFNFRIFLKIHIFFQKTLLCIFFSALSQLRICRPLPPSEVTIFTWKMPTVQNRMKIHSSDFSYCHFLSYSWFCLQFTVTHQVCHLPKKKVV